MRGWFFYLHASITCRTLVEDAHSFRKIFLLLFFFFDCKTGDYRMLSALHKMDDESRDEIANCFFFRCYFPRSGVASNEKRRKYLRKRLTNQFKLCAMGKAFICIAHNYIVHIVRAQCKLPRWRTSSNNGFVGINFVFAIRRLKEASAYFLWLDFCWAHPFCW